MKCQKLLSKKKFLKLNKSFKNFKLEFLNISSLNEKITLDLKASLSLKDNFDKTKKGNDLLSKEILELRKETLDHLLDSQRSHGLMFRLSFLIEPLNHQVPPNLSKLLLLHTPFLVRALKLKIQDQESYESKCQEKASKG